jgi:quercetin dioxygenase-like cupin family protein
VKLHAAGRGSRLVFTVVTLLIGAVLGMGVDHYAFGQQPGIKRTILLTTDAPSSSAYQVVQGVAEIPAGMSAGRHRHYGIEVGYVLQGSVELEHEGEPNRKLSAGEGFLNAPGIHNAKNTGKGPVKILAVYIVEKGKPLAEPVP